MKRDPHTILLTIGRSLKLISAGAAIGLVVALMSTSMLQALLYNVSAFDTPTFVLVTILLAAVALGHPDVVAVAQAHEMGSVGGHRSAP